MDWNQRYLDNDTPWEKEAPAPILKDLLKNRPVLFSKVERALVPGCGSGHDTHLLASHGVRSMGFDISENALEQAAKNHSHPLLEWQQGDLFLDLPIAHYSMGWEHTCFCAIDPSMRDDYVEAMAKTLRPGGFLLGIFFIETGKGEGEGPPYKASVETIKEHFFSHFSLEYQLAPTSSFPERAGKEHLMLFRRLAD